MTSVGSLLIAWAIAPAALMLIGAFVLPIWPARDEAIWRPFRLLLASALVFAISLPAVTWGFQSRGTTGLETALSPWLNVSLLAGWMAALVQLLGTAIGFFSSRYLQGENGQARYAAAFAGVLASVHLLLLANHWLVLIATWAAVGVALQHLLCFYRDRPFALLAAHKKRIADRISDALLLAAAALAWAEVGSGSLSALRAYLDHDGGSSLLQASAVCLVLAVILRTALFPVHGWLIQVMEAPTPVSALLHAGVVNLGGYLLIRLAALLEVAEFARWLLVAFGLGTALLAGLVMLTRISIKVRLAWSTVAQMGFMILECGLGLYTLAALHLIGHSLYKAHAFLSASSAVQETKLRMMRGRTVPAAFSLVVAPALSVATMALVQTLVAPASWPWWWNGVFALAWAPLLWLPSTHGEEAAATWSRGVAGVIMVAGLTVIVVLVHKLPLGVSDAPFHAAGPVALVGMALMYLGLASLQWRPERLSASRRWSYAGFYVDEFFTRLALRLWPARWTPANAIQYPQSTVVTKPAVAEE